MWGIAKYLFCNTPFSICLFARFLQLCQLAVDDISQSRVDIGLQIIEHMLAIEESQLVGGVNHHIGASCTTPSKLAYRAQRTALGTVHQGADPQAISVAGQLSPVKVPLTGFIQTVGAHEIDGTGGENPFSGPCHTAVGHGIQKQDVVVNTGDCSGAAALVEGPQTEIVGFGHTFCLFGIVVETVL